MVRRHPIIVSLVIIALMPFTLALAWYGGWALFFDMDKVSRMPATTIIYDRNGLEIERVYEQHRLLVPGDEIPRLLKQAFISTEDRRFYYHPGFDPFRVGKALFLNASGEQTSGASTITMQLARNSADMFEKTMDRKLKELFLAVKIEAFYSKDTILTFYLNRIYFGGHVYGIGAAAEAYFGKEPKDLSLSECALLAGIIAAPNKFSPWEDVKKARYTRKKTLQRMLADGYITDEEFAKADKEKFTLRPIIENPGTYVVPTVMEALPNIVTRDQIRRGGLRIYTTIDLRMQLTALRRLREQIQRIERSSDFKAARRKFKNREGNYLQGAVVGISNHDGGILCVVGGRSYEHSPFNRATQARRQVGSTIKPIVFAHGFNVLNLTAFTAVDGAKFDLRNPPAAAIPVGKKPKWISLRKALEKSDNYAAMRVGLTSGVEGVAHLVKQMTGRDIRPDPASMLGGCELSPFTMAHGYTTFANYGVLLKPFIVNEVRLHNDSLYFRHQHKRRRVLSPEISFQVHDMMRGVVDRGTARSLRTAHQLKGDYAGKTGTTNDYRDSWFVGYSSEVTLAVWLGFDYPVRIMNRGYSSRVAVPVWGRIMKDIEPHYKPEPYYPPEGVRKVNATEEKSFLFFWKKRVATGEPEYVRDDQRENALMKIDDSTRPSVTIFEERTWMEQTWDWFFPARGQDLFHDVGAQEPTVTIYDTRASRAPRAVPVGEGDQESP